MKAFSFSLPRIARPADFLQFCVWFALLLFAVIALVPPESVDMSLARLFYKVTEGAWVHNAFVDFWAYKGAKWVTTGIVLATFVVFLWSLRKGSALFTNTMTRLLASVIVSLVAVWLLNLTSGVACPWSLAEFSPQGAKLLHPFAYLFTGDAAQGRCWPAGHAGTGFALFGFFFAVRRLWPERKLLQAAVFAAVMAFGLMCAATRMLQGAHFLSHSVATMLLDFAIAGLIFSVKIPAKPEGITPFKAALVSGVVLTLLTPGFFAQFVGVGTWPALTAAAAFFVLFILVNTAVMWPAVHMMPARGWRIELLVLTLIGAVCNALALLYGTVLNADMVRNALATDFREAYELVSLKLIWTSFVLWLPGIAAAFWLPRVVVAKTSYWARLKAPAGMAAVFALCAVVLATQFSAVASFFRNQKEARYAIAPYAVMYSLVRTTMTDDSPSSVKTRLVIDDTPKVAGNTQKPLLVVMVVGETARAADWDTAAAGTKELDSEVIRFNDVTACGTSTDVSLPCMMSRVGRSDYDRKRILAEESILSVIQRAGTDVRWVDNQSGCKGACTPEMLEPVAKNDKLCPKGVCWDGAMLGNIDAALNKAKTTPRQLLVLHMMGSHGPAYWRRTPPDFRPFGEGCLKDDLSQCKPEDVRISYRNSIAYTRSVLTDAVRRLKAAAGVDTVLLYVSDHGESLGEKNLWLHGAPYWMGINEQMKVPMVLYAGNNALKRLNVERTKLAKVALDPASHDNLADTLLGLTETRSKIYTPSRDLLEKARKLSVED